MRTHIDNRWRIWLTSVYLKLVGLAVLDKEVDELSGMLHEVNILVHGPVHDEQATLLLRQLAHIV